MHTLYHIYVTYHYLMIGQQLYRIYNIYSHRACRCFSFVQESKETERSHACLTVLRLQSDGRITEAALQKDG